MAITARLNDKSKPIRMTYYGRRIFYICPKCGKPITFRRRMVGKSLCLKCGQKLDWAPADQIRTEMIAAEDAMDAASIAEDYYQACGLEEKDWFNLDAFRKSLTQKIPRGEKREIELYLFFKGPKEYGRFKRLRGGKR